ncbi:MAG TPA: universal stress protein [Solirubrobacterales bacterium]|nr:universal stress protein [Solirubrobacterales bacterium]
MATFTRVLVGHDGGKHAEDALSLAKLIAERTGAELVLASVIPNPVGGSFGPALPAEAFTELAGKARASLEAAAARVGAGVEVEQSSSAAHGLQAIAERIGADLIVVGSSPSAETGHTRAGRKARQLLSGADCAIAVAPDGFHDRAGLDRIGVGIDGSPESRLATETAVGLAPDGSELQLLAVAAGFADEWRRWGVTYPLAEMAEATRESADALLKEMEQVVPARLTAKKLLLEGTAPIQLAEASAGLDLLCLGSRGYGPVRRVLLGSVSSDVMNHAASAVLVVPRTDQTND